MGSIFTIAVGMALPEPKRIELLPAKEPFLSKVQMGKLIPILAPLITFFIFLGIIWYMNGQVTALQKERDAKMAKIANLETLQAKLKLLKEKELQIKEKLSLFPSSMIVSVPYREILREVSRYSARQCHTDTSFSPKQRKTFEKGSSILKTRGRRIPKG